MKLNQIFSLGLLVMMAGVTSLTGADYLPLRVGNTWTYQSASTGETFQIQVRTPFVINNNVYYALSGYGKTQLMVRNDTAGNLVYFDSERDKEFLLTSFEPVEGAWWEAPGRECLQEGQTQSRRGEHTGPGGNWNGVLEIHYRTFGCADIGTDSEQYAENVGMVRRVVNTFAGPRTFNLVYAHVGSQTIEAGDHSSFSVSVQPSNDSSGWLGTVRLDLGNTPSIRLGFPTSQLFDAVLKDEKDNVLWRWSSTAIFLPVVTSRQFSGEWSTSFVIPHPGDTGGVYTLEGFLTNDTGPKFSGAVKATAPVPASVPR